MKKSLNILAFTLWSLLNLGAAVCSSIVLNLIMGLKFDEMNTLHAERLYNPNLTHQTVVYNVITLTCNMGYYVAAGVVILWLCNYTVYNGELRRYRKAGLGVFILSCLALAIGMAKADSDCLKKYPQKPPVIGKK